MPLRLQALILSLLIATSGAHANTQGRVSVSEANFVSEDYEKTNRKDFQFIGAGVDTLSRASKESEIENSLQAQVHGVVSPGVSVLSYLNVSQLFWKQNSLTVGRKKMSWSLLDEDFQLGMYQPLFKWNPLFPEAQGLTGMFFHLENTEGLMPWGWTLFASPLFIPDQGPGYETKDGKFENSNPYFQYAPTKAQIYGETLPITYDIHQPQTQEIIFNRSLAVRGYLGDEHRGFFTQVAYANKPSNQLSLGFDAQVITNGFTDTAHVDVTPAISYHNLVSADIQYATKPVVVGISALHENPESPQFKQDLTYVRYDQSDLLSPFVRFRVLGLELHLAALSVNGGSSQAFGKQAAQSGDFLAPRYPFSNAGLAAVTYRYRLRKNQAVTVSSRYLQGERSEFALWTTQLKYQWEERWAMNFQSQMIDVRDTAEGRKTAYWPFVNNDVVAAGVSYVF